MTILNGRSNDGLESAEQPRPASASMMTLPATEADQLLVQLVLRDVVGAMNSGALSSVERRLAVELARLGEQSDARLLAIPRELIARALRRLADDCESGGWRDDHDLDIRYENAICREAVAELEAAQEACTAG